MYDKYEINRCNAMEWLKDNYPVFPTAMPDVPQLANGISDNLFEGWGFVVLVSGELVFADCLSPCITASDMANMRWPELA